MEYNNIWWNFTDLIFEILVEGISSLLLVFTFRYFSGGESVFAAIITNFWVFTFVFHSFIVSIYSNRFLFNIIFDYILAGLFYQCQRFFKLIDFLLNDRRVNSLVWFDLWIHLSLIKKTSLLSFYPAIFKEIVS